MGRRPTRNHHGTMQSGRRSRSRKLKPNKARYVGMERRCGGKNVAHDAAWPHFTKTSASALRARKSFMSYFLIGLMTAQVQISPSVSWCPSTATPYRNRLFPDSRPAGTRPNRPTLATCHWPAHTNGIALFPHATVIITKHHKKIIGCTCINLLLIK